MIKFELVMGGGYESDPGHKSSVNQAVTGDRPLCGSSEGRKDARETGVAGELLESDGRKNFALLTTFAGNGTSFTLFVNKPETHGTTVFFRHIPDYSA